MGPTDRAYPSCRILHQNFIKIDGTTLIICRFEQHLRSKEFQKTSLFSVLIVLNDFLPKKTWISKVRKKYIFCGRKGIHKKNPARFQLENWNAPARLRSFIARLEPENSGSNSSLINIHEILMWKQLGKAWPVDPTGCLFIYNYIYIFYINWSLQLTHWHFLLTINFWSLQVLCSSFVHRTY